MASTAQRALPVLTHLILTTTSWGGYYQMGKLRHREAYQLVTMFAASRWQSRDLNPDHVALGPTLFCGLWVVLVAGRMQMTKVWVCLSGGRETEAPRAAIPFSEHRPHVKLSALMD